MGFEFRTSDCSSIEKMSHMKSYKHTKYNEDTCLIYHRCVSYKECFRGEEK